MTLVIGVLGPLVIGSGGLPVGKLPKKARALLAYLAAEHGRTVSRERLADLLWPYQASEQARHSLRNCLLELRKTLGPGLEHHLLADFSSCRLGDADVDLGRFEQLSHSRQLADLEAAADCYRGEFLADFIVDSEPFQEWLAAERDRALDLVCSVLQRLIAVQDAAGQHDAAIRSARRLVSLDPLSEIGQRALIRAYARAGRRPEALRQYRSCAELLKRELGVAPDAETQALANGIARSGSAAAPAAAGRPAEFVARGPAPPVMSRTVERAPVQWLAPPTAARVKPLWPCVLPSIGVGVAPIRNLTGDASQQYLVDAFTDDLVTDLLRHGSGIVLKQVANEPSFTGRPPEPADSGLEYVISGSAQRGAPGALRVVLRITHVPTAEYVWAGRHEFKPEELGSIQTKITRRISRELYVLGLQEASRRAFIATGIELGVKECLARAAAALSGEMKAELTAEAQQWFLAALARDPRNVEALTLLAGTCQHLISNPWWGDPQAAAAAADLGREAVAIALDLAPGHALAKCIQGMLRSAAGQLEEAARSFKSALTMDRELAIAHGFAGYNAALLGHAEDTLPAVEWAMGLDQTDRRHSIWYFFGGFSELLLGRTETALELLGKSLERNREYGGAQLFLMSALALIGRRREAAELAAAFREQYPEYPSNAFEQLWLSRSASAVYRSQIAPIFEQIRSLGIGS
ncbi:MAG TPA: BTAD domain-containing putative transcriptional regulator [Stellaceae bacterium]